MSDQTKANPPSNPIAVHDPYKLFEISLNPDGSLKRNPNGFPTCRPRLIRINPSRFSPRTSLSTSQNTCVRIFLPRQQVLGTSSGTYKLPLIVYFHGGGFIQCSASTTGFHVFCSTMALQIQAIVVSVDYRLAPEHRLPAAYDDAMEALCGNIVYHAGIRASDELEPLKIRGLILHQPFFGGSLKVESELRLVNDPVLPPGVSDMSWELALPIGGDCDHEYCNPTSGKGPTLLGNLASIGWRVLVTGCDGDPLIDRQLRLVKLMEEKGV
ncbi:carboxylesterase 1-like [Hibiscus syriacus]|uniref:Carboxylesterase 1-like n=1 Tax=Hibiscus syriacus TaxID=106335 RepID=A0A6A2X8L7_HIBSY|nr:carboxylesterase 1-like [Hibiscus syriacus]